MKKIVKGNEGIIALDNEALIECIFCNSNTAKNNLRKLKIRNKTILDEEQIYCFVDLFMGVPVILNEDLDDGEYMVEYIQ
jgi:hypothetical protein